ncbi:MAG: nucleoside hydrolase [Bacteroidales bacterium]
MKKLFLIILLAIAILNISAQKSSLTRKTKELPVPVIFDTDIGNDIDDVLALNMLFNYQKHGKIDLLGITISKSNLYVIKYVDGFCRFNNYFDMPLGYAYHGVNPEDGKYLRQVLDTIIDGKKILFPIRSIKDSLPEGYKLQRQLLSTQLDKSVVMIVVGPETNIARLLNSPADEFSPLSGLELIKKKVKLLSIMGGLFSKEFDFPEWNIVQDLKASQDVFSKWPTPIVASGWELGNKLLYPHQSILNDFPNAYKNPMCVSYKIYEKMPYDRQTWDLTSVLYAIEQSAGYFELSVGGRITIVDTGKSIFTPDINYNHKYLIINPSKISTILNILVNRVVGNKTHSKTDKLEPPIK